ncbi:2-C-methyl-D-erythritol 4-phosphate cytidylyltransferase [Natronosporangium hydrolyticum]|uniref:2-C-methyl-D-erythritol 4-phosphate cytidylyltransferase n=1 Tax=Natronosporangium hydrolyticum TaxID=2811111 RepID=A0A895YKA6_9ACTN|nr:2-C-methyl-D-erythritol 4-phosphate cytidylyltransferase [Natronosporangium hydrolyticum]QSB15066.1 2-C-methyl-D-erythritol 4-phosphate cytidylyltransferase [Natronosporangium hydrolyticum]
MTTLRAERRGDVAVLIPAGGAGVRLGPGGPKALRPLAGEPLLVHAVRRVFAAGDVGWVVVAAPAGAESAVAELLGPLSPEPDRLRVVTGGAQRQHSVAAALAAVPAGPQIILVHDAARALTPPDLVTRVAAAVRDGHRAVIPVLPVVDTVVEVTAAGRVAGNPDRSALRAVQTPQGFARATLEAAHAGAVGDAATDDAGLVSQLGIEVHTVPGSAYAMKITTPYDLTVATALVATAAVPDA